MKKRIAPSILSCDFSRLGEQCREAISEGIDILHIDVMDGHFVPNITIGPLIVEALRPLGVETSTTLDVHLMIENPEKYIDPFAKAGSDILTVHYETCPDLDAVIEQIRSHDVAVGLAINPDTPVDVLVDCIDIV